MPIYDYKCDDCGKEFETFQGINSEKLTKCKSCGKETLRRLFSPPHIIYKGTGFYSTSNRSKNPINEE